MNKTKKGFMTAGSIISLISVFIMILTGFILIAVGSVINEQQMCNVYDADSSYERVEEVGGDYYYIYTDPVDGQQYIITSTDIQATVNITKTIINSMAIYFLALSIAILVFAILVLKHAISESNKKFAIITLLVLSVFTSNLITMAFMIVALCLKDKQVVPAQEQINIEN